MIDLELDEIERKILNIKLYEEDYQLIKIAIVSAIQSCYQLINNEETDQETKVSLQKKIDNYKKLLAKLDICELYNENV